jgi:hypothetical protein
MLTFYNAFEINDFSGEALSEEAMAKQHYGRMKRLQTLAFNSFQPELRKFALSNIGTSVVYDYVSGDFFIFSFIYYYFIYYFFIFFIYFILFYFILFF